MLCQNWNLAVKTNFEYCISGNSFQPWIVSSPYIGKKLFKFSLYKRKPNAETIWDFWGFENSNKNSFRVNYLRKYGTFVWKKNQYSNIARNFEQYAGQSGSKKCVLLQCRNFAELKISWEISVPIPNSNIVLKFGFYC